jgi:hypothetical protein
MRLALSMTTPVLLATRVRKGRRGHKLRFVVEEYNELPVSLLIEVWVLARWGPLMGNKSGLGFYILSQARGTRRKYVEVEAVKLAEVALRVYRPASRNRIAPDGAFGFYD